MRPLPVVLALFLVLLAGAVRTPSHENWAEASPKECLAHIRAMIQAIAKDFGSFLARYATFLVYSGKTTNDLGNYFECVRSRNNSYTTVLLTLNQTQPQQQLYVGLCLHRSCDARALAALKEDLLLLLQELCIQIPEQKYSKLQLYQPDQRRRAIQFAPFWITLLLLSALAVPVIVLVVRASGAYFRGRPKSAKDLSDAAERPPKQSRGARLGAYCDVKANFYQMGEAYACPRAESLAVMSGIRLLSFLYISLGLTVYCQYQFGSEIGFWEDKFTQTNFFNIVYQSTYSADVLFFLSGFFLAHGLSGPGTKMGPLLLLKSFACRVLRLWPGLILALLCFWSLSPLMVRGP